LFAWADYGMAENVMDDITPSFFLSMTDSGTGLEPWVPSKDNPYVVSKKYGEATITMIYNPDTMRLSRYRKDGG